MKDVIDFEGKSTEITFRLKNREQMLGKCEQSPCDLCENIKESNICVIGMLEGEKRGKGAEKYLKK